DEEDLTELGLALRAVGEFRREPLVVAPALARQLPRLARRLARLRRAHALVRDLPRGRRVFLERFSQSIVDDLLDQTLDLGVAELGLRLALELRVRDAHRHDGRQPFAHVVTRHSALEGLEESLGLRVVRDRPGERRPEAREMGPALARVD